MSPSAIIVIILKMLHYRDTKFTTNKYNKPRYNTEIHREQNWKYQNVNTKYYNISLYKDSWIKTSSQKLKNKLEIFHKNKYCTTVFTIGRLENTIVYPIQQSTRA